MKPPRRQLFRLLWGREHGAGALVALVGCLVAGVLAADAAAAMVTGAAAPPVMGGLVRSFHSTMLYGAGVFAVLLTAARLEGDHRSGWLVPLTTAGAGRVAYTIALAVAVTSIAWMVFVAGAGSFAVAMWMWHGSDEVLRLMPRMLAAAIPGLAGYALTTVVVGGLVRAPLATAVIVFGLIALPWIVMLSALTQGATGPTLLVATIARVTPSLLVPVTPTGWAAQLAFAAWALVLASVVGHYRTARYA